MRVRTLNLILIVGISLFLTACGGDGGGGNGKRGVSVTPDLSGAKEVSVGENHVCAILKTGKLACWGDNEHGKLGTGNTTGSLSPVEVDLGEGREAVAIGNGQEHTCAILDDGSVVCWGQNTTGQLGDGTTTDRNAPVGVDLGEGRTAVGISLGYVNVCAHLDDGSLVCWGHNQNGQVGDGTSSTSRVNPTPVGLGSDVKARTVSVGSLHACAILDNGTVVCWGGNSTGQLGDGGANLLGSASPVPVALEAQRTATAISLGANHTCAVLDDGSLVCWGLNDSGQLGDGTTTDRNAPVAVDLGDGKTAVTVSAGKSHTCALLDDNSVKCWGKNDFGQLGDESITNRNAPATAVDLGDKTVAAIRAGGNTSCALFEDGSLTCWGSNENGQLGTGEGLSVLSPQAVSTGDETVTAIDGGREHSCGLFEDEDDNIGINCWGENVAGQLGIGDKANRLSPTAVAATASFTSFSVGSQHTCVISSVGSLGCMGKNGSGQLGIGNNTDYASPSSVNLGTSKTASAVSAGHEHTCAILNDEKVKCWGEGGSGRLGNGASTDQNSPVSVSMSSNTAKKISTGRQHTCAIFNDDKVYCWGENGNGQLGIGSTTDQNTPSVVDLGMDGDSNAYTATAISTGSNHTCAILNNNSVKCWGANTSGQLGDRSVTRRTSPVAVPLGSGRSANAIYAKGDRSCAILDDGSLLCWGFNNSGPLGDGTTTDRNTPVAVDLGEGRTATAVGGGSSHTCAILDDESLKCWGNNNHGQTGLPTAHRGDQPGEMGENLVFVDLDIDKEEEVEVGPGVVLVTGRSHSCTIDEDGTLKCWGGNYEQQLGVGTTGNQSCIANSSSFNCIRTPVTVDLGTNRGAQGVAMGLNHTCAILDDGSVKCWGKNEYGQLGDGSLTGTHSLPNGVDLGDETAVGIELGEDHSCALLESGSIKCWGNNDQKQVAPTGSTHNEPIGVTLPEGRTARDISLGRDFSCALLDDDSLVCWGQNNTGELGVGDTTDRPNPTAVTFSSNKTAVAFESGFEQSCAILNDGSLVCWGDNNIGQLGVGDTTDRNVPASVNLGTDRTALDIALGQYHSCALLDDKSVKCWGSNGNGELGDGTTTSRNAPVAVTLPRGRKAKEIYAGGNSTCALLDDNSYVCWGANYFGQLLDGTTIDRYTPVRARL